MGRIIDADKLCIDLMERWDIADKQKEELIRQVMADVVVPIVASQPIIESKQKIGKWIRHPEVKNVYGGIYIECSECRARYLVTHIEEELFCRNCGSFNAEEVY